MQSSHGQIYTAISEPVSFCFHVYRWWHIQFAKPSQLFRTLFRAELIFSPPPRVTGVRLLLSPSSIVNLSGTLQTRCRVHTFKNTLLLYKNHPTRLILFKVVYVYAIPFVQPAIQRSTPFSSIKQEMRLTLSPAPLAPRLCWVDPSLTASHVQKSFLLLYCTPFFQVSRFTVRYRLSKPAHHLCSW